MAGRKGNVFLTKVLPPIVPLVVAGLLAELLAPKTGYSIVPTPSAVARDYETGQRRTKALF